MNFDKAETVDSLCWQMRLADYPRGLNRSKINSLFNGFPPFSEDSASKNGIQVNVNFLEGTVLSHDARAQFYGAFMKPGQFFTARTDYGKSHKQQAYGTIVTSAMNKVMKRSKVYYETFRSKFAMDVLHGIGPSAWRDSERWCPDAMGIEDILIPANTLLTMENLPFYCVYRSYTAPELIRMTADRKKAAAAGWNMDLVDDCIKWVDENSANLMSTNWPEVWSPEKRQERVKGDGGFYAGDQVATIDCYDFFYYAEEGNESGWRRRMILDTWGPPSMGSSSPTMSRDKSKDFGKGKFLFNSGKRKYADQFSEMVSFQFADLSAVAPFRYHSVRSLGFLLYSVCHLQNRIRCRFNESVFEALMNYYRVRSADDVDRALKIDLINRGFVDETVEFIPQQERWQVNAQLIELGLNNNKSIIDSNSSSYTQQPANNPGDRKTKFQVMSEMSQTTALVQSAFNQAYQYQEFEYREIFRRFCRPNSTDPEVRAFRAEVLRKGVPDKALCEEYWEIEPTRVMGAGNKTMEMAIAEQLLQMRNLFDPEPQREILREVTFNITGDADRALRWVPDEPLKVTDSVHDAQLAMGTLMQGLPVAIKTGQNHKEYVLVLMQEMGALIQKYEQQGGMAPADKIEGFQAVAQNIQQHLQLLSQDKEEKAFVAESSKQLSKLMNMVRAFAQRLQEQMQKQQQQQGPDPKMASMMMLAKAKADNARESHAQRTAQKQLSWQMEERRKDMQTQADINRENLKTAHEVHRGNLKSINGE